jgi:hypothetical protein
VCTHDVLNIQADHVAWHPSEDYVNIYVQAVIMMRDVYQHVTLSLDGEILAYLCHAKHYQDNCTSE